MSSGNPIDDAAAETVKNAMAEPTKNSGDLKKWIEEMKAKSNVTANISTEEAKALDNVTSGNTLEQQQGFGGNPPSGNFQPDVQVTPPPSSAQQNTGGDMVRPATKIDLKHLDESMILGMPFIKARTFDIPAMLELKPKEDHIRFRWVNYKNYEGGNYAMFKAIGFANAEPKDVEGTISEHLLKAEDGTIKWFDVILMKVPVLHLMGIYKSNMIRSLNMVGRWKETAIKQAIRTVENEVGSDIWDELKKREQKVEFYAPSQEEMRTQDKTF